MGAKLGVAH